MSGDQTGGYAAEQGRREDGIRSANAEAASSAIQRSSPQGSSPSDQRSFGIQTNQTFGTDSIQGGFAGSGSATTAGRKRPFVLMIVVLTLVVAVVRLLAANGPYATWPGWVQSPLIASVIGFFVAVELATFLVVGVYSSTRHPSTATPVLKVVSAILRWGMGSITLVVFALLIFTGYFGMAGAQIGPNAFEGRSVFDLLGLHLGHSGEAIRPVIIWVCCVTWFVRAIYKGTR